MVSKTSLSPVITIDFKRDRIRIHKRTLRFLGDPEYVLLLVNPEDHTIAIMRCDRSDLRAYRLPKARLYDKQSFEITSKCLLRNLLSMCGYLHDNHIYRLYGELVQNEGIVQFSLAEFCNACGK